MTHSPYENLVFGGPGGPKMEPTWLPKCFKNQAPVRGASGRASGSDFGRFLEGPRGSPEAPESAPGAPGEPQDEPQEAPNDSKEAPNDPQEGEKEPQEGQSELREASASVLGRISDAFPSNARRPRRLFPFVFFRALFWPARETPRAIPPQSAERGRGAHPRSSTRTSGLLVGCSRCSCRSCVAAPPGARALALDRVAALAALAFS